MSGKIVGQNTKSQDADKRAVTATDFEADDKRGLDTAVLSSALPTGAATAANQATMLLNYPRLSKWAEDLSTSGNFQLGNNETFNFAAFDMSYYGIADVTICLDSSGTFYVEHCFDQNSFDTDPNIVITESQTITVSSPGTAQYFSYSFIPQARYMRFRYTNGGGANTYFCVDTTVRELVRISDSGGIANTKQLGTQLTTSEVGLVTNTIIHGKTTAGGGSYVDMKVTPSGAASVEGDVTSNGQDIATQATLADVLTATQAIAMAVSNSVTATAYNLNSASYSATSNEASDYILDHIEFNFTTVSPRTITVTAANGTVLWTVVNDASLNIVLEDIDKAFNGGDNFTITVTQTSGACLMDVLAVVKKGATALVGQTVDANVLNGTQLSSDNSTTTPLNNAATYTGTWEDTIGFNSVTVAAKTDQSGLLYIEFSPDASNADSSLSFNVAAATNEVHRLTCTRRYFRVRFTNDSGSNQTYLRLQSMLGNHPLLTSALNSTIQTDADTILTRSIIYGQDDSGDFTGVNVDEHGHMEVAIHGPLNPFGSLHCENLTPVFQVDGVYGINSGLNYTTTTGSGAVSGSNSLLSCSTGTTIYSQASLQSRKRLRYRPGQGVVGRFTAIYTTGVADSYQVVGVGHPEDGYYIGYVGTQFGILKSSGGTREVQTLTLSSASSTNENVTVTLNGTAFSVAVTNSANINRTAWEISRGTYAGWKAEQIGSTIIFVSDSVGNKAGAFTLSGTTAAGTFAETRAGSANTDTFIAQADFNVDKLDGTGGSGFILDPTKLNIFEIRIQYLGAGTVEFKCETYTSGINNPTFRTFHTIKNPNTLTGPHIKNPSFPFTMAAYSAGSTTDVTVKTASYAGFIEGQKKLHGNRLSYFNSLTTVGATNIQAICSVRNDYYYNGKANQAVINLTSIAGAIKHTSPVVYYLIKNGTLAGNVNFTKYSSSVSCSSYDTAATTVTYSSNEQLVRTFHVGDTGEFDESFIDSIYEEMTLQPGEWLTLGAKSVTGSPSYVTGSINTREDQ